MKNLDLALSMDRPLRGALCRRYAAVVFSTIQVPLLVSQPADNRTICWALGCLVDGACEILGAWHLDAEVVTVASVFGDLHERGVEFIRCGIGNLGDVDESFRRAFRMGALYPSMQQTIASFVAPVKPRHREAMASLLKAAIGKSGESARIDITPMSSEELRQKYPEILGQGVQSASRFQPLSELPEPCRGLVWWVDQMASEMQERLMRSIHRHGMFTGPAEVFDFVVDWLARADDRLRCEAQPERTLLGRWELQSVGSVPVARHVAVMTR